MVLEEFDEYGPLFIIELYFAQGLFRFATRSLKFVSP